MKTLVYLFLLFTTLTLATTAYSQSVSPERAGPIRRGWPIIVSLQFHSLSLPFRDVKTQFSNVGLSLGTEFSYNRKGSLVQGFQIGYYRNRQAGDGLMAFTQTAFRPTLAGRVFTELKAGAGWQYAFHPSKAYVFSDGGWKSVGSAGKSTLIVPLGVSVGYNARMFSPFVSYQFFPQLGYNASIPLIPNNLFQFGSRIHFTK